MSSLINWENLIPTVKNCYRVALVMFGLNSVMAIYVLYETMSRAEVGDQLDPALVLLTPVSIGLFYLTLALYQRNEA